MQASSLNHLPQMQTFVSMRSTPFMEIDDKGGEVDKDMKYARRSIGEKLEYWELGMDMDQEGAILKNGRGSKFLNKRSRQVGGASS